jgi:hypothetical protein
VLRVSPDGGTLFTGVHDGTVRVLPLDFPCVIACLCRSPPGDHTNRVDALPGGDP